MKLRVDYFLSKGLKFIDGDIYTSGGDKLVVGHDIPTDLANMIDRHDLKLHIVSLVPRENDGVQPVADNVPVFILMYNETVHEKGIPHPAAIFAWKVRYKIRSWFPDIDGLIEMQKMENEQ